MNSIFLVLSRNNILFGINEILGEELEADQISDPSTKQIPCDLNVWICWDFLMANNNAFMLPMTKKLIAGHGIKKAPFHVIEFFNLALNPLRRTRGMNFFETSATDFIFWYDDLLHLKTSFKIGRLRFLCIRYSESCVKAPAVEIYSVWMLMKNFKAIWSGSFLFLISL